MGSEHDKIKKNSKYSDIFNNSKTKNKKNRLSVGDTNQNSNILNEFKKDKEINEDNNTLIKSKTDEMISKKEKEENIPKKKERKVTIDGLKSLSSQNLVKIEQNDDILKNEINEGENNKTRTK